MRVARCFQVLLDVRIEPFGNLLVISVFGAEFHVLVVIDGRYVKYPPLRYLCYYIVRDLNCVFDRIAFCVDGLAWAVKAMGVDCDAFTKLMCGDD